MAAQSAENQVFCLRLGFGVGARARGDQSRHSRRCLGRLQRERTLCCLKHPISLVVAQTTWAVMTGLLGLSVKMFKIVHHVLHPPDRYTQSYAYWVDQITTFIFLIGEFG